MHRLTTKHNVREIPKEMLMGPGLLIISEVRGSADLVECVCCFIVQKQFTQLADYKSVEREINKIL